MLEDIVVVELKSQVEFVAQSAAASGQCRLCMSTGAKLVVISSCTLQVNTWQKPKVTSQVSLLQMLAPTINSEACDEFVGCLLRCIDDIIASATLACAEQCLPWLSYYRSGLVTDEVRHTPTRLRIRDT